MTAKNQKTRPNRAVKERTPLGGNRNVMTVDGVPKGYIGRWINDINEGLRITNALAGGYEFVTAEGVTTGDRTVDNNQKESKSAVVTKNVGGGITSYLMAIKKEFYDEDQVAKEEEIAAQETDIFRKLNSGTDGTYGGVGVGKPIY